MTRPARGTARALSVVVVHHSAVAREALAGALTEGGGFTVRVAADVAIALRKLELERADVVLLELARGGAGGLRFVDLVSRAHRIPILLWPGEGGGDADVALAALEAGAVDIVVPAPLRALATREAAVALAERVRAAARARVRAAPPPAAPPAMSPPSVPSAASTGIVAVGASTGGTEALLALLGALPATAPGLVIVQHMPAGFTAAFAARLDRACRLAVKEAADGDAVLAGRALLAPGGRHLVVERRGAALRVRLADDPPVCGHRPSVDVLFRSVAASAAPRAVGVLLTGMGNDGADAMVQLHEAGAYTIAQDEATCVVFGMPREAIARGAVDAVIPLPAIAAAIQAGAGRS